jgi:hypothetical protein
MSDNTRTLLVTAKFRIPDGIELREDILVPHWFHSEVCTAETGDTQVTFNRETYEVETLREIDLVLDDLSDGITMALESFDAALETITLPTSWDMLPDEPYTVQATLVEAALVSLSSVLPVTLVAAAA